MMMTMTMPDPLLLVFEFSSPSLASSAVVVDSVFAAHFFDVDLVDLVDIVVRAGVAGIRPILPTCA